MSSLEDLCNEKIIIIKKGKSVHYNIKASVQGNVIYTFDMSKKNFSSNDIGNEYIRINNVIKKSIESKSVDNLNIINPATFNNSVNFMNYNFIYEFRLDKYYNENYNYYNYANNYIGIYKELYSYYINILEYPDHLNNLKNNHKIYQSAFYELFSSYISNSYNEDNDVFLSDNYIDWNNSVFIDDNTFDRISENVKPNYNDILYSNILAVLPAGDPYPSGYCRYRIDHRYGGGCECSDP